MAVPRKTAAATKRSPPIIGKGDTHEPNDGASAGTDAGDAADPLAPYWQKRDFATTPEPRGTTTKAGSALSFVVQKHAARNLHYDFRLELAGTLKSWAVPKGPSLDPAQKRMAVHVEDHPLAYGSFEGVIPPNQYGAGQVIVWDRGTWEPVGDAAAGYRAGKLKFRLDGEKLHGVWNLVRMHGRAGERQEPWLLIKERDDAARAAADYSVVDERPDSVLSGRSIEEKAVGPASKRASKTATGALKTTARKTTATKADAKAPRGAGTRTAGSRSDLPDGAVAAALPDELAPELATLVSAAPAGTDWTYEIKFDGYRILARVDGADVRLVTRNGNDWTAKLKHIAAELGARGLPPCWLDGEIVVLGDTGASDFGALQRAFEAHPDRIVYFAFDLPHGAGHDLRATKLEDRRRLLASVLGDDTDAVRFSHDFAADASDILRHACRLRLEGVIGKRLGSPYVSGRTRDWIKLKCTSRQEFVIGGFTEPQRSRTGIGALLLGLHDEQGRLRYAGNVGSGFDTKTLGALRKQLDAIGQPASPFFEAPRDARGAFVRPELVAEVSFSEWTKDRKVRHAVFHGLRSDKPAEAIGVERAVAPPQAAKRVATSKAAAPKAAAPKAAPSKAAASKAAPTAAAPTTAVELPPGVRITHPERVIDPASHRTKQDLVDYYVHAARRLLPHLAGRPVAVVRAPSGIGGQLFFQKHSGSLRIAELVELPVALDPGHPPLIEIDSFTALVSAAQMNVVELHTWNAASRAIEKPDRMLFDLDPGDGVAWPQIVAAARAVRTLLEAIGLVAFLKTSGGKGLHVVVPLTPRDGWDDVKDFSRTLVETLAAAAPDRVVAKSGPKNRIGKIFIDYLRNGRGSTTAAAFSARARAGLGVSVPCDWDELDALTGGDHWNIATAHERLEASVDPWAGYDAARRTLSAARKALARAV